MTVRTWLSLAVVQVVCLGCSANDANPPSSGGGSGQGGGGGSTNGGSAGSSAGGQAGSTAGAGGGAAAGSAGSAGAGGSGGAVSMLVTPTVNGSKYTFSYGDVVFEVDPSAGGRIVTFSKAGTNLMDDGDGDVNYGSTLWPSPQAGWPTPNWPPPAGIDSEAYTAALEGSTLVLTGPVDAAAGLSATKRFSVDSGLERVEIVYSLKNEDTAAQSVAAWEVTRVAGGGLTFWPAPSAGVLKDNFPDPWDGATMISWHDDAAETLSEPGKVNQDGLGWLAHAQGTLLFVKTFPDIQSSAFAPDEAEVEIYSNQDLMYVELENQGEYVSLEPAASLTYTVHWYLRTIPGTVTVASGSQTLYDFAAAVPQ